MIFLIKTKNIEANNFRNSPESLERSSNWKSWKSEKKIFMVSQGFVVATMETMVSWSPNQVATKVSWSRPRFPCFKVSSFQVSYRFPGFQFPGFSVSQCRISYLPAKNVQFYFTQKILLREITVQSMTKLLRLNYKSFDNAMKIRKRTAGRRSRIHGPFWVINTRVEN